MDKSDKDILTTAEAARLLGVSVRTAQLLIEGGTVPSWKTPGGHRRVYRADIEALIDGGATDPEAPSASVIVVAPVERAPVYDRLFGSVPECDARIFSDPHAALFEIGSARPHAVIVDLDDADPARLSLLESLVANPSLGHSRIVAVGPSGSAVASGASGRMAHVDDPVQATAEVRRSVAGVREVVVPQAGVAFPIGANESRRLVALERSGLLDTPPEEAFDRLTWLAAQTLKTPVSLVALLTPTRQWFKSRLGLDLVETPRSWAFCNHTILQKGVFWVEDLAADPRFAANPAVAGDGGFRFYAGAPLLDGDGLAVGSLCVIDHTPRALNERDTQALSALAALGSTEVRFRSAERQLREALWRAERQRNPEGGDHGTGSRGRTRPRPAVSC